MDAKKFADTWSSPAVDAKIAQAKVLADRYGLIQFGVPTLVVNSRWITGGGYAAYPQIMQVVNQLVQQEQAAMPPSVK